MVDVEEGNKNAFSIPFYINLRPNNAVNIGIPREGFERIQTNLESEHQSKQAKFKQIEDKYQEVEQLLAGLTKLVESNAILQVNQEQKLEKLQRQRDAIHLAKQQLQQWSVTASSQIYNILKQCLQQRQYLTEDLIPLQTVG